MNPNDKCFIMNFIQEIKWKKASPHPLDNFDYKIYKVYFST